jgi:hypothetical protein
MKPKNSAIRAPRQDSTPGIESQILSAAAVRFPLLVSVAYRQGQLGSGKEVSAMADKVKCVPKREGKKPGPKNVKVRPFVRSSPKPINKKCS